MTSTTESDAPFNPALPAKELTPARFAHPGRRALYVLGSLGGAVLLAFVVCLQFGAEPIPFLRTMRALGSALSTGGVSQTDVDPDSTILLVLRMPRLLMALFVGGMLSLVGACLQALLRNPLADPYVLGISSGATLGATLALTLSWVANSLGSFGIPLFALSGGLLVMVTLYRLAASERRLPLQTVLLMGVVMNAILSALSMFLTSVLSPEHLARVLSWLMGSLAASDAWRTTATGVGLLGGVLVVMRHAHHLNGLLVGEDTAHTLGISVESVKRTLFFTCAVLTGLAVAVSGMIGFVGMVVPHALRLIIGTDHRLLLPASVLAGGGFLMCADTLARTILSPSELPVGVMTALIGGPLFVHILLTHRQRQTIGVAS